MTWWTLASLETGDPPKRLAPIKADSLLHMTHLGISGVTCQSYVTVSQRQSLTSMVSQGECGGHLQGCAAPGKWDHLWAVPGSAGGQQRQAHGPRRRCTADLSAL